MKPDRIEECGCCEGGISATPEQIINRSGLSKIVYRVGTYASFRQAMIEAISRHPELKDWKARKSDDYGIAMFEMWSYIADILAFYQERIANESFLRTALHRDTIMRLAGMLDYKLNPGVAANTYLPFITEKDSKVNIPVGLKVQSVPGQDEKLQKFETAEAIDALSDLNEMRLQSTEQRFILRGQKQIVFKGVSTDLEVGDYILIVGKDRKDDPGSERWDIRKLNYVKVDSGMKTTTVGWEEGLGHRRIDFPTEEENADLDVFAMRIIAWPFGVNAPDFKLSPKDQNNNPIFNNWTNKYLPEDNNNPNHIFLDNIYETIEADTWIALAIAEPPPQKPQYPGYSEVYFVESVDNTVIINYTLTSKVSRLTVDGIPKRKRGDTKKRIWPEHIQYFPMQGTMVLAQSEPLEKADVLIETPLSEDDLVFEHYYPDLRMGQTLFIKGELSNEVSKEAIELIEIKEVIHGENFKTTSITLRKFLQNSYKRKTVRVYGNVAKATHGETVSREILGNGDASSEFQSFVLKKSPTTFVSAHDAPRGAKNTLEVCVGDVLWREVESLYGQSPNDLVYVARTDDNGVMSVQFGDGRTGARLPTGQNNVTAKYRQGLGSEGNVAANSISVLLDRPIGLKSVNNPIQTEGGTDPESLDKARINAPNTVKTFDRAISLGDYEDLARGYTGVAKAKAAQILRDEDMTIQLTIVGEKGESIERTSLKYKNFIAFLDNHRDKNHTVDVIPHSEKQLVLKVKIKVEQFYLKENVLSSVRNAILSYFDFNNLQLGQGIHLSDVYAVVQSTDGVIGAIIEYLDYKVKDPPSPPTLRSHLRIKPDQIAVLKNDDLIIESDLKQGG